MALVRNAANTLRKGRIGETTYYTSKGRQIARQALNNSNYGESARRSIAQQTRRVKWANLVNFYKLCAAWMPKAFENKKAGQTDYNKFMQLNTNAARVALTRDQAINGGAVVDALAITQGTLPSVTLPYTSGIPLTALKVPTGFALTTNSTVGQLATALISENNFVLEGMQLSGVVAVQTTDGNGIPRVAVSFYEVKLESASPELLSRYITLDVIDVDSGVITLTAAAQTGQAAALILSQQTDTGLKVSSETLAGSFTTAQEFSTDAVVAAAIDTYGVDREVILSPDAAEPIA